MKTEQIKEVKTIDMKVDIDLDDLAFAISRMYPEDILHFIKSIDEEVDDWGFTNGVYRVFLKKMTYLRPEN